MKQNFAEFLVDCVSEKIGGIDKLEKGMLVKDFVDENFDFLEKQITLLRDENTARVMMRQAVFATFKKEGEDNKKNG